MRQRLPNSSERVGGGEPTRMGDGVTVGGARHVHRGRVWALTGFVIPPSLLLEVFTPSGRRQVPSGRHSLLRCPASFQKIEAPAASVTF